MQTMLSTGKKKMTLQDPHQLAINHALQELIYITHETDL
jgi:hypothetical protein